MCSLRSLFIVVIFAVFTSFALLATSWQGEFINVALASSVDKPDQRLKDIGNAINHGREKKQIIKKRQVSLSKQIKLIQGQSIKLSKTGQELERKVSKLQSNLESLARQQQQQMRVLEGNRQEMAKVVSTLYHFYQRPVRSFVLYPGTHKDAIMAEVLMRYWVPALQDKALEIEDGFAELADLKTKTMKQLDELRDKHDALKSQKNKLIKVVSTKNNLL